MNALLSPHPQAQQEIQSLKKDLDAYRKKARSRKKKIEELERAAKKKAEDGEVSSSREKDSPPMTLDPSSTVFLSVPDRPPRLSVGEDEGGVAAGATTVGVGASAPPLPQRSVSDDSPPGTVAIRSAMRPRGHTVGAPIRVARDPTAGGAGTEPRVTFSGPEDGEAKRTTSHMRTLSNSSTEEEVKQQSGHRRERSMDEKTMKKEAKKEAERAKKEEEKAKKEEEKMRKSTLKLGKVTRY